MSAKGRPQWFMGEPWAAETAWLSSLRERIQAGAMSGEGADLPEPAGPYVRAGGVAVITVKGSLTEAPTWWDRVWGADRHGYSGIRKAVRAALADPHVTRIVLRIDSPGGHVSGCNETAEVIANATKPTEAHATMACSAGYWIAAACDRIVAPKTAIIGCLGVQLVVKSDAKADELGGFWSSPYVQITSAETPGKNADPEGGGPGAGQYQDMVDDLWAIFRDDVATYRDRDRANGRHRAGRGDPETLAEDFSIGSTVTAGRALARGMIDEIRSLDMGSGTTNGAASAPNPTEGAAMPKEEKQTVPPAPADDAVAKAQAEAQAIREKAQAEAQAIREKAQAAAKVEAEAAYQDRREAAVSRLISDRKIKPFERDSAAAAYDLEHRFADAADATGCKPWSALLGRKPDQRLPSQPEGDGGEGVRETDAGALGQFNDWAKKNDGQARGDLKVALGAFEREAGTAAADKVSKALFGDVFTAMGGAR